MFYNPYSSALLSLKDLYFMNRGPAPNVRLAESAKSVFRAPGRQLKEFSINGRKVMAFSRKDAITRLKHQKIIK